MKNKKNLTLLLISFSALAACTPETNKKAKAGAAELLSSSDNTLGMKDIKNVTSESAEKKKIVVVPATVPKAAEVPKATVPKAAEVPKATVPKAAEVPKATAPKAAEVPKATAPKAAEVPKATAPKAAEVPKATAPKAAEVPKATAPKAAEVPKATAPKVAEVPKAATVVVSGKVETLPLTSAVIDAKDIISNYLTVSNLKVYSAAEIESARQQELAPNSKKNSLGNYKYLIDIAKLFRLDSENSEAIIGMSKFFVGSSVFAAAEGIDKKNVTCRYSRKDVKYEDMYHYSDNNKGYLQFFPTHLKVAFSDKEAQETGSLYYVKCKNLADDRVESFVVDMVVQFPEKAKTLGLNFNATPDPLYTEAKSVNFKNLRIEKDAPSYIVSVANQKYFNSTNTQKIEFSVETLENASCMYAFEGNSVNLNYILYSQALEDKNLIPVIQKDGNKKVHYFHLDKNLIPVIQKDGNKKVHYFHLDKKLAANNSSLEIPVKIVCAREGQIMATSNFHHIKIDFKD